METDSQDTYGKASQTLTILFERRKKKIYLEKKKKSKMYQIQVSQGVEISTKRQKNSSSYDF